ncbi:MAG: class I SAM-dependent methyltransferase [Patescibacteria group bacterium]
MINLVQVIQQAGISPAETIADFGAGSGFIAMELAKAVGPNGKVYAIDILEDPLDALESRAKTEKFFQIETIKSDLEKTNGSTLEPNSCDWVLVANLLFQIENPETIIKEANRILKPGGKILAIEWLPEKLISQQGHFFHQPDEIKKILTANNFIPVKELKPSQSHYGLIFQKQA